MKIAALTLAASFLAFTYLAKAQDCSSSFFVSKEGTKIEMTSYDKNGRITGKSVTTLVTVTKSGTMTEYKLKSESTDSKKNTSTMDYTASCDGNTVSVNMKSLLPAEMQSSGGEVSLEGNNITFPNSITIGEKLNDGTVTMTMSMGGMTMKTVMNIVNRTVTGKESITTPAGAFDCYTVGYDVETSMMGMNTAGKVKQWIAKGVGTVRSENYNDKGNLMGYTVVTAIK